MAQATGTFEIGVDIGGTFTDVVCRDSKGATRLVKIPTTRRNPSAGVKAAMDYMQREWKVSPDEIVRFVHGTTVATNAVIEAKGAKIGLLTTVGFKDVLEIGRQMRHSVYDLMLKPETPGFLAPGALRKEVRERVTATGDVLVPLDESSVVHAVDALVAEGVDRMDDRAFIERDEYIARGRDALAHLLAQRTRCQEPRRLGLQHEVINRVPHLAADLEHVLESHGREQADLCSLGLDHGVSGDRGAVYEADDLVRRHFPFALHVVHRGLDADARIALRRRDLDETRRPLAVASDDVGKGAADVDADLECPRRLRHYHHSISVREMTGDRTRRKRAERRLLARAQICGLGAARAKAAARREISRVGRLALEPESPGHAYAADLGNGRDQRARIGMSRPIEYRIGRSALDDATEIHHRDAAAH